MDLKAFVASEVYAVLHGAAAAGSPVRVYSDAFVFDGIPELPFLDSRVAMQPNELGVGRYPEGELARVLRSNLRLHAYRIEDEGTDFSYAVKREDQPYLRLLAGHVSAAVPLAGSPEHIWY